ncbi:MAG: RNA polymerase factor sigma-54 [Bacteroidales bacterium]|nr:RNA polymerase factor sigma-54 [Bacteroidales bacterium]
MLKQSLQQKMLQKLSPQQIQMIKLLEIPTMQLEQRIKKEMEENPALEEGSEEEYSEQAEENTSDNENDESGDEFSLEDYLNDEDIPSYKLVTKNHSAGDERKDIPYSGGTSFHEQLETQLGLRMLTEEEKALAKYIIGNIDEDGYLRRDLEAIVDDLAFSMNMAVTEEKLLSILRIIQDFDPAGVGARNLQECLILQIEKRNQENVSVKNAELILRKNFDEFTKKHYDKIIKKLGLSDEEMKAAVDEILKLNPKPGSSFADSGNKSFQQIIPDFILENNDGILQLSLNARNVPDLRVSPTYADMIEGYTSQKQKPSRQQKDAISFVKQKLDSAKWFIDAIKQRQNTLLVTMNAIIEFQEEYFQDGDETKLRPMILKDIADKTGLDISTISRVASSKYIQTQFGIISLKYFFSEAMQTDSGEEVSTREIKSILQECIDNENKKKPVTDDKLTEILKEKGYVIARRTVAKYREQLNIPVARLRKEL